MPFKLCDSCFCPEDRVQHGKYIKAQIKEGQLPKNLGDIVHQIGCPVFSTGCFVYDTYTKKQSTCQKQVLESFLNFLDELDKIVELTEQTQQQTNCPVSQ